MGGGIAHMLRVNTRKALGGAWKLDSSCLGVGELLLGHGWVGVPHGGLEANHTDGYWLVNTGGIGGGHRGLKVCMGHILEVQVRLGMGHCHREASKGSLDSLRRRGIIL